LFKSGNSPLVSFKHIRILIPLLNALKLHLKLVNFQNQKKNFPKKLKLRGDILPLNHLRDLSPHPPLAENPACHRNRSETTRRVNQLNVSIFVHKLSC
jgi:hypothetical protein